MALRCVAANRPISHGVTQMRRSSRLIALAGITVCLLLTTAQTCNAQDESAASPPDAATTTQPAKVPQTDDASPPAGAQSGDKPGPKYLSLRYDEDFSYLEGPEDSYQKDFFDPIKHIRLSDNWTLRLGGEFRTRMESETNKNFGQRDPTQDTFLLYRTLLHTDFKFRDRFRIFFEGIDARIEDRDLPQVPGMENRFDLHQLFFDWRLFGDEKSLTLRLGRQEMIYGRERVIGQLGWMNEGRRFDGAKLLYKSPKLDVDLFWVKPVFFMNRPYSNPWNTHINEGMNRKLDHFREEQHFYGMYATYKGIPRHVWDFYVLGLNDRGFFVNANNRFGDLNVYTIGSRFAGKTGNFDYEMEGGGQWGKWDGDEVQAWMFATDNGYTFADVPWSPRIGVGFDYASGDDSPRDRSHQGWNQLYPTGHAFLGYMDLLGRQNVLSPNLNLTLKPLKSVTFKAFWHHFWLDSNLDGLYNAGGVLSRRDVTGASGKDVGDEIDLTVQWQMDAHSSLLVGWSHFWPSNFINSSGFSRDSDFFYVQYQFKF